MDDYLEQYATQSRSALRTVLYFLMWFFIIIFAFLAAMNVFSIVGATADGQIRFNLIALIAAVVFGGSAFLMWRRVDYLRVDYDYTFTNGTLDVGCALNNRRRRYMTSVETREVLRCGPVTDASFQKVLHEQGIKKHNWFCNRDAKLYYFYFVKKGVKHVCILELSDEMVALIRSKSYLQPGAWASEKAYIPQ